MPLFTPDIRSMQDLHHRLVQELHQSERQIARALPYLTDQARSSALRQLLADQQTQSRQHVRRLQEVAALTGTAARGMACPALEGLLHEARGLARDIACPDLMDAALAAAAQAVKHYEISRYRTLIAWSRELGHESAAAILTATLAEERVTDARLSSLAEARLNHAA